MMQQPTLNDREWQLILNLLESERRDLPQEIRHTDTPKYHDDLQERMRIIDSLVDRLQKAGAVQ
jgi:hypothetical protein